METLTSEHWNSVQSIYLQGIATGNATFQTSTPDWDNWDMAHLKSCRIIAKAEASVLGWAALSPDSSRPVYAGVAEVSIYVVATSRSKGIGSAIMATLITRSEAAGIWTLQAGIFPENTASIQLHQRAGFREVGLRRRIGCLNGIWRDVVLLERRSGLVGMC